MTCGLKESIISIRRRFELRHLEIPRLPPPPPPKIARSQERNQRRRNSVRAESEPFIHSDPESQDAKRVLAEVTSRRAQRQGQNLVWQSVPPREASKRGTATREPRKEGDGREGTRGRGAAVRAARPARKVSTFDLSSPVHLVHASPGCHSATICHNGLALSRTPSTSALPFFLAYPYLADRMVMVPAVP